MKPPSLELEACWNFGSEELRHHYLVSAHLGKKIVGRAHGWFEHGGQFILEKVEIEARYRGRGYGSSVIALLREKARASGCSEFVFSGVRKANTGAIKLYESLGAQRAVKSDDLLDYVISPP